ncbi:uncharacterized protein LOC129889023 isoform X3 [Solanum dulcamara]|uniref:uncharacterized protein LOC129889023 isoform X3 n=1 Tax=Solanum dulcamara TaxID=45834 RepID=UPI002485B587|nr:uncharacterized protein LOC129889023 isoform X3 [Solanum dulcamara]
MAEALLLTRHKIGSLIASTRGFRDISTTGTLNLTNAMKMKPSKNLFKIARTTMGRTTLTTTPLVARVFVRFPRSWLKQLSVLWLPRSSK